MPKVIANDAEFYYEIHGKGHPVILISGYTCDHLLWMPILEDLSKKYQVIIFDNRAVGQTQDPGAPLSIELMAEDVIALAKALNLHKPHIVGQSMGGTIAQVIGRRFADRVDKLVLLVTAARFRKASILSMNTILQMRQKGMDFDLIFQAMLALVFGDAFLRNEENVALVKRLTLENPFPQSVEDQARQFAVLEPFDGRDQLKEIKAPTLVVYGKEDVLALPQDAHFLASHIPQAKIAECEAAHGVIGESPKQLVKLLSDFFK